MGKIKMEEVYIRKSIIKMTVSEVRDLLSKREGLLTNRIDLYMPVMERTVIERIDWLSFRRVKEPGEVRHYYTYFGMCSGADLFKMVQDERMVDNFYIYFDIVGLDYESEGLVDKVENV